MSKFNPGGRANGYAIRTEIVKRGLATEMTRRAAEVREIRRHLAAPDPNKRVLKELTVIAAQGHPIPDGSVCALFCLSDAIIIVSHDRQQPPVRYGPGDLVDCEIGGPGLFRTRGGFAGGGFGPVGAAEGMLIAGALNTLSTRKGGYTLIQLVVRSGFFLFQSTTHTPDQARVALAPLVALVAQARSPAPAAVQQADPVAQLKQLAELRDSGVLNEAEFQAAKAKLLTQLQ